MSAKFINETEEAVAFAVLLSQSIASSLADDGKVSLLELAGMLQLIPSARRALDGISEVPAEIADMDESEAAQILEAVSIVLAEKLDSVRHRVIAAKSIRLIHSLADLQAEIRGVNPPKAEPVEAAVASGEGW